MEYLGYTLAVYGMVCNAISLLRNSNFFLSCFYPTYRIVLLFRSQSMYRHIFTFIIPPYIKHKAEKVTK